MNKKKKKKQYQLIDDRNKLGHSNLDVFAEQRIRRRLLSQFFLSNRVKN